jgi:hypothetical protein
LGIFVDRFAGGLPHAFGPSASAASAADPWTGSGDANAVSLRTSAFGMRRIADAATPMPVNCWPLGAGAVL